VSLTVKPLIRSTRHERRPRRAAAAAAACALALGGCGAVGGPDIKFPTTPAADAAPSGDSATFAIDGQTIFVRQTGSIESSQPDVPQLTYSGPLGCRGRFFTADLTEHVRILFRYTRRSAYLLLTTGDLYTFHFAPPHDGGVLRWDHRFEDGRHIAVAVRCERSG
jgi:hypothetical protein